MIVPGIAIGANARPSSRPRAGILVRRPIHAASDVSATTVVATITELSTELRNESTMAGYVNTNWYCERPARGSASAEGMTTNLNSDTHTIARIGSTNVRTKKPTATAVTA